MFISDYNVKHIEMLIGVVNNLSNISEDCRSKMFGGVTVGELIECMRNLLDVVALQETSIQTLEDALPILNGGIGLLLDVAQVPKDVLRFKQEDTLLDNNQWETFIQLSNKLESFAQRMTDGRSLLRWKDYPVGPQYTGGTDDA